MLGLRHQVGGKEFGVAVSSAIMRIYWAPPPYSMSTVPKKPFLAVAHRCCPGDDFVNPRYRLGAVSEGGDSLSPADKKNPVHTRLSPRLLKYSYPLRLLSTAVP